MYTQTYKTVNYEMGKLPKTEHHKIFKNINFPQILVPYVRTFVKYNVAVLM